MEHIKSVVHREVVSQAAHYIIFCARRGRSDTIKVEIECIIGQWGDEEARERQEWLASLRGYKAKVVVVGGEGESARPKAPPPRPKTTQRLLFSSFAMVKVKGTRTYMCIYII